MSRPFVYIAGAYSGKDVIATFGNMRRGLRVSAEALRAGFAVYSPWCDCLLHFQDEFTLEECYDYSMSVLEHCSAILVVQHNYTESVGTMRELRRAQELDIPVFHALRDMIHWKRAVWEGGREE